MEQISHKYQCTCLQSGLWCIFANMNWHYSVKSIWGHIYIWGHIQKNVLYVKQIHQIMVNLWSVLSNWFYAMQINIFSNYLYNIQIYTLFCFEFLNFIYFFIQRVLISHQFYTHQCIHVNPNRPIQHTTTPICLLLSPLGVHMFLLYICVSISALQTGSSVPFFQVPHICVNIRYLFFSF